MIRKIIRKTIYDNIYNKILWELRYAGRYIQETTEMKIQRELMNTIGINTSQPRDLTIINLRNYWFPNDKSI